MIKMASFIYNAPRGLSDSGKCTLKQKIKVKHMSFHIYVSIQHVLGSFKSAFTVFYHWSPDIQKSSSVSGGHFRGTLAACTSATFAHLSTASSVY